MIEMTWLSSIYYLLYFIPTQSQPFHLNYNIISDFDYFLKKNDLKIYENEINLITRRMDFDNDGKITLSDYE